MSEGAAGVVLEAGVKIATSLATTANTVTEAGVKTGAKVTESAAKVTTKINTSAFEAAGPTTGHGSIGLRIGETASRFAKANREGTEIAAIRRDLDALILEREIAKLNDSESSDAEEPLLPSTSKKERIAGALLVAGLNTASEINADIEEEIQYK